MTPQVPDALWHSLGGFVAANLGLYFPLDRRADLQRGFAQAAQAFGFDDHAACIHWLLVQAPTQARLEVLASHLTIGETYFFRDQPALDALATGILGPLIETRRHQGRRLHLWSAGCSTGEEAYTLAILLHRLLPDLSQWQVSVTATDINAQALRKARAATYGDWSFRDAPPWLRPCYFRPAPGGRHTVVPEIRDMVRFGYHNLAGAPGSASGTDIHAMDVILCRNVLMYLEPAQLPPVITRLRDSLAGGGWLVTSPSEASRALFPGFAAVEFPDAIVFRRQNTAMAAGSGPLPPAEGPAHLAFKPAPAHPPPTPALQAFAETPAEADTQALATMAATAATAAARARALANQGHLPDALQWCDHWLAADRLAAAAHHLRGMVLIEQGDSDAGKAALQKALYLAPGFVLAHVALGQLDLQRGAEDAARRHFGRASHALRRYQPDDLVPEAGGLTAGALAQTLRRIAAQQDAA